MLFAEESLAEGLASRLASTFGSELSDVWEP